ncbi:Uncharacterized protein HA466_0083950 [Hirschfeldia incana]|nr:Uncharacterized protein HA466_0083950 [Hirschfeldia incana]
MRNLKSSAAAAAMRPVKKEPIVIDLDSDDEDVLCGEINECMMDTGEANPSNMQMIYSADAATNDGVDSIDPQYMKLYDSLMDDGNSYLSDNPLRCIRYEVDNGGYDTREFKGNYKSREDQDTGGRATKKNVAVSRPPPHRVQASQKKTKEFVLRRRESPVKDKSHARRNSQRGVEAREKEIREAEMVPDENYRSHLASLVEKWKSSSRRSNPGKEIQVKCEEEDDAMSLSDSDSIEVDDRPFLNEEDSPFVPSKSYKVVDLEEESDDDDECNSWFRKEIMNVLKQPYSEKEFKELEHEASVCRWLTKSRELLDGRDFTYTTNQKKPSYLDQYPEFKRMFERALDGKDRYRALNLLRGFIFYLTKVARHDAFKPWLDHECLKTTCF